ncbi:ribosomal protection-like ABC-F family protein [Prevotella sp. 10(H)]|uniref:ribosomal protection-like ABC-F family protein n=1 Tax=Prevotella sp. 10(H) TaxID=1158294 RepID=UPI0004A78159|nr:ABC-F family ATP-binding cassette domain-containing protein [Prevotella sp. 10(H)]
MSISVQEITYTHPDKEVLFRDISFYVSKGDKVAITGDNGSGKSTMMQLMAGNLVPSSGEIICSSQPYYVPQHFGQYNHMTVAEALRIDDKLQALYAILSNDAAEQNFAILGDDWTIEERSLAALSEWGLENISFSTQLDSLSGGEKTKVFLAGIEIHQPDIILMDEPTNHLDFRYREKLYHLIGQSRRLIVIISHDRALLNRMSAIYELSKSGMAFYPGNYEFYKEQKELELQALQARLEDKEKELRLARKTAREVAERKQKHEVRGKKNNMKKGVGKMAMDTLQDKAEKSNSKLKDIHADKMSSIAVNIAELQARIPDIEGMKTDFNTSVLHRGKILVTAENIQFSYGASLLWTEPLNFQIRSGDRIAIRGSNGSGKTTVLKLITGELEPAEGILTKADFSYVYLDQDYSIINDKLTVYEQVEQFSSGMQDYEIKTILNRFLFPYESWNKSCRLLSGGEKMKMALCCLMVSESTPDMFILDEPTNNIDIQNIEILTNTVNEYRGTVLLVSHDSYFAGQVGVSRVIDLDNVR